MLFFYGNLRYFEVPIPQKSTYFSSSLPSFILCPGSSREDHSFYEKGECRYERQIYHFK